jgi:hypothetical protein
MVVQVSILVNLNIIHKVGYKYSILDMAFENHNNSSLITITKLVQDSHDHANKDYKYHQPRKHNLLSYSNTVSL